MVDNENLNELVVGIEKELTDFELKVFELKKNGFNYREIAEALGVETKKIDNAIQRIKVKIKKYLEKKDN